MLKLKDYSGPYRPNFKLEDFSKEGLVKLVQLYSKLYIALDGFWYLAVKENISDEQAVACDLWAWGKAIKRLVRSLAEVMNIQGDNVATLMKILQVDPYLVSTKHQVELINENHSVLTVTKCPLLEALEKEGGERIKIICGMVDPIIFKYYAESIHPDIEVKALKLPPRRDQEDICCQWEYSLDRKRGGEN